MVRKRNIKYRKRLDASMASAAGKEEQKAAIMEAGTNKTGLLVGDAESDSEDEHDVPDFVGDASSPPAKSDEHKRFEIEFENLGFTLPTGVEIMRGVTGDLKPGRLCAVMGPSGAGKTTFVSLLTNKAKRTSGTIRINGIEEELSKYRKLIGFVPQEDVMLRELTVRDILMHSALMRLPVEWSNKRKKDLVLETISFLGLDHIMDNVIGNEEERGISGGQRKRVNIGMELVAAPSVLFLDEPTSGLDSATSFEVCSLLHTIAREQFMTIAAVVHSPSPAAFNQFDDLLLLGKGGRIIYFGHRAEAIKYFERIGFTMREGESAADFFMEVATGRVPCRLTSAFRPTQLFTCWENYKAGLDPTLPLKDTRGTLKRKTVKSTGSKAKFFVAAGAMGRSIGAYFADVGGEMRDTVRGLFTKDPVRRTPNPFTVFYLCYLRACTQLYRNPGAFWFDQVVHLLCGIFISVGTQANDYLGLYPQAVCRQAPPALSQGPGCQKAVDQLPGSGMFICLGLLFGGVAVGAGTFGRERVVYWRDASSGMATLPYFMAKWIADIPRIIIAAIMYTLALILFLPFRQRLFEIFDLVLVLYFAAFSMGYFLSSVIKPQSVALAATGFVLLWSMLFGGVNPQLQNVMQTGFYAPIRWLWSVSAPRWAIEAWYIKEAGARPWIELHTMPLRQGAYDSGNYATALVSIVYIGLGWALLAILGMKLVNRDKQK
ncbi:uncharacterized protein SPPG_09010 [Spizellomyces punctatus DAOM BR117]|uniref:ABC transporter domain-containing protein n=1 Tax=Spizellomyces punctatus (strain DAOM BR117) TaxID=645134 RepID=A0A0L0HQW2_SPIPD|nr:uncharacterized protein SPPG_09010 [Spizellomyces punctatus DAOM BR117]KND03224.1 hypothetical protein SPPG_09010 [Spizellomyces punctatus DAOM BR117]|eukprot:XP_016611263.1 hypothetical protein SPPG_09010 [Spizellomyces punctatus DAOM BR117]